MPGGIYKRTKEHNMNIAKALTGKKITDKHRENLRKSHLGKCKKKRNSNWRGGRHYHHGYFYIYCPSHPCSVREGYVLEHRLVMEKHIGRVLTKIEVVHHINGNASDNRIENLMLFSNHSRHMVYELHLLKTLKANLGKADK